jgi:hypothetical protein
MVKALFKVIVLAAFAAVASFVITHRNAPTALRSVTTPQVSIATLISDGEHYSDAPVRITGQVVPTTRFSVLGYGMFQLRDATGATILVVSRGQSIPPIGGTTTLMGVFKSAFQVGPFNYPVVVQD